MAGVKEAHRTEKLGSLLRSKGFCWLATSHNKMGIWSHSGNVISLEASSPWLCLAPELWEGTPAEASALADQAGQYGDRRQELVFIGTGLRHSVIQDILDACLLQDEEMRATPQEWHESMSANNRFSFSGPVIQDVTTGEFV